MSREHRPIQIGLPPESAWQVAEPAPISLVAFVAGDELPDPGDAFLAAGRAFGAEPVSVEPMPVDDPSIHWAFAFEVPGRGARVLLWCEHARPGHSPDGRAPDARHLIVVQTILEPSTPDDQARAAAARQSAWPASVADFARLAATAFGAAGAERTRILFDPDLGTIQGPDDCARLYLADGTARGELVDERHLYRIELRSRAPGQPVWISSVGLARVGKPELEMLEVPPDLAETALQLVDALAARFVSEDLPHAGVPFEAGPGLVLALVPAAEVAETVPPDVAGSPADRARLAPGPRAAICAAGQRGSFRKVWLSPLDELRSLADQSSGLYLSQRVTEVRERHARATWADFAAAWETHGARGDAQVGFFATVARVRADGAADGEPLREHVSVRVAHATASGGSGGILGSGETIEFSVDDVSGWSTVGLHAPGEELGPYESSRLRAQ